MIDDREEAIKFARDRGQLKIYDLGAGEEIETLTQEERRDWKRNNKPWSWTKAYFGAPQGDSRVIQRHSDQVAQADDRSGSDGRGLEGDGTNPGRGVPVNRIDLTPLPIQKAMNRPWRDNSRRHGHG